ncbi:MAG: hypothetical protein GY717_04450 [Rhodobacteraceae bacterium]|nr:hypothetical protein [Paracoccaceae bacterium]
MRSLLAPLLALGFADPATALDCTGQWDMMLGAMGHTGFGPAAEGVLTGTDGACSVTGMHLSDGQYLRLEMESLQWQMQGLEMFATGVPARLSVTLDVENARLVPQPPDAALAYLLDIQNRWNFIDGRLEFGFDPVEGVLDIVHASVDFPGNNGGDLSLRVEGVSPLLFVGNIRSLDPITLTRLELSLENEGYLDSMALGFLQARLDRPGQSPEDVVAGVQLSMTSTVDMLPDPVFDSAARGALVALIADGPLPRGALSVVLDPGETGVRFGRFAEIDFIGAAIDPARLADAFGEARFTVSYAPRAAPE